MRYNLRGEEKEKDGIREKTEHRLLSFLRYFFPAVWPVLLYFGISLSVNLLAGMILPHTGWGDYLKRYSNLCSILGVLLTFFILRMYSKRSGSGFFEDASLYLKDVDALKCAEAFLFGAGAALALSAVITLLPDIGPVASYNEKVNELYTNWSALIGTMFNAFFTPLVEEVIWRGYMLNRLLPHWGERAALFAVTAVFALSHGAALWVLYAFAMGWLIGRLSIAEDNILYGIVMHMGFNTPAVVLWFIYMNVPGSEEALYGNKFMVLLLGLSGAALAYMCYWLYIQEKRIRLVSRLFKGEL